MKRAIIYILIVLLGTVSCYDRHQNKKANYYTNKLLYVKNKSINLGTIEKSLKKEVPFYYQFNNESDSAIIIHNIEASCGCVEIDKVKKIILPGEKIKLNCKIITKNISGYINKNIYVNYNKGEVIILKVEAVIK